MMELPLYRRPRARVIFNQALTRTYSFVKRAGPVILILSLVVWFGTNFPNYSESNTQQKLEQSYLGQVGKVLEPIFAPMGSDWRVGVGLLSAFAAREVFVSSLAIVFNVADDDEDSQQASLLESMRTAVNSKGQLVFTGASVVALIVFFMIALQCMSTVAIAWKENASWKYAIGQLVAFNVIAYILAVGVYNLIIFFA